MGAQVILTEQAQNDLREIVEFIARDSPQRAERYGLQLVEKALSIGAFPHAGRVVPERRNPAIREIIHGSYRVVYKVVGIPAVVYVLRFWHAARGTPDTGDGE